MILAYVDPGLGALIWQTVVSALVGFLFYLKKTRQWIVGAFRKTFGRGQKSRQFSAKILATKKVEAETDVR